MSDSFNIGDKAVLNFKQFAALYRKKVIEKIIFPRDACIGQRPELNYLRGLGLSIEDIWIAQRLSVEIFLPNFLEPYINAKYLPYLEFHVADHCNSNCAACEHYSGLVKEPHFPNLEKFTRDFERLHEFIDDIGGFWWNTVPGAAVTGVAGYPLNNRGSNAVIYYGDATGFYNDQRGVGAKIYPKLARILPPLSVSVGGR